MTRPTTCPLGHPLTWWDGEMASCELGEAIYWWDWTWSRNAETWGQAILVTADGWDWRSDEDEAFFQAHQVVTGEKTFSGEETCENRREPCTGR